MIARAELAISSTTNLSNTGKPPVYVISSNRSQWLGNHLHETFSGKFLAKKASSRPIIFVVGSDEYDNYLKNIAKNLSVKTSGLAERGVYVLSCKGGFGIGWNRHCALKHARQTFGHSAVWMLDDDITGITDQSKKPTLGTKFDKQPQIDDLPDAALAKIPVVSLWQGIMQKGIGFNLKLFDERIFGGINFCPLLAFSKEDLCLQAVIYYKSDTSISFSDTSIIKASIKREDLDREGTLAAREKAMKEIAAIPIWKDAQGKTVNLADTLTAYQIMRLQEQIIYNCITDDQALLQSIVEDGFFSDTISD